MESTENDEGAFLVIVYPQDSSASALRQLASDLRDSLQAACREAPVFVRPNMTALCVLTHGRFDAIRKAVDDITDAYSHWLVVRVGTPFAATNLSTADQWLRQRT